MYARVTKIIALSLSLCLITQLTACGTILYPQRKGQVSGQIDPGVAILDGIGLFFFLIPGVIAFAVDFSNGTIYLPGGHHARLNKRQMKRFSENGKLNKTQLIAVLQQKGLLKGQISAQSLLVEPLKSQEDLSAHLALFASSYASN